MNTYYASPHHYHTLKYPFHDTQLVNLTLGYLPRVLPSTLKGYWPNISVNFSIDFCFMWEWDGAKRFYVVASSTPSLTLPVQDYVLLPPPPKASLKALSVASHMTMGWLVCVKLKATICDRSHTASHAGVQTLFDYEQP